MIAGPETINNESPENMKILTSSNQYTPRDGVYTLTFIKTIKTERISVAKFLNIYNKTTKYRKFAKKERKEMFYLMTHSTHFIYSYMVSDIW